MDLQEPSRHPGAGTNSAARGARPCGSCTACCVWLPIPAGHVGAEEKPAGRKCPLLGVEGCSQYAARPTLCRDFRCSYLKNPDWPESWRPDRSSLLCLSEVLPSGSPGSAIYELAPGQLASPVAQAIVEALRRQSQFVVLISYDGQRLFRPGFRVDQGGTPGRGPHFAKSTGQRDTSAKGADAASPSAFPRRT